jgi:signal transduction histidine kinase
MVAAIERGARRMNAMIEQMLVYGGNGGAPVLTETALGEVFAGVREELAGVVAEKRAEVTIGPLPTVYVDAEQMSSVARALLSNALRFSRPGVCPRVAVRSERATDRWRVSVTDNGVGVPPERREAMFVLFARADKRIEGDGVGLAAARRVVEAHGGRIGMEGAPDGGTTVWFDLPV